MLGQGRDASGQGPESRCFGFGSQSSSRGRGHPTRERGDTDPATSQCKRSQHRGQALLCWSTPALPLASGAPQVLWESRQTQSPAARAHTEPLPPTPLEARGPVTLVGEPRIGGRGFRCRKSGSLGEPRRGRQDCSPWEGCGGLACGWPNATPSGSVGGLGSLGRTTRRSDRFGALCRRQPSPALWGECSGAEEPRAGQDGPNHSCPEDCLDLPTRPTRTVYRDPHACSGFPTLHCAPEETGTEELRHLREVTQHGGVGVGSEPHSGPP